jgi:hypothetical protein
MCRRIQITDGADQKTGRLHISLRLRAHRFLVSHFPKNFSESIGHESNELSTWQKMANRLPERAIWCNCVRKSLLPCKPCSGRNCGVSSTKNLIILNGLGRFRRPMLYPVELRAQRLHSIYSITPVRANQYWNAATGGHRLEGVAFSSRGARLSHSRVSDSSSSVTWVRSRLTPTALPAHSYVAGSSSLAVNSR